MNGLSSSFLLSVVYDNLSSELLFFSPEQQISVSSIYCYQYLLSHTASLLILHPSLKTSTHLLSPEKKIKKNSLGSIQGPLWSGPCPPFEAAIQPLLPNMTPRDAMVDWNWTSFQSINKLKVINTSPSNRDCIFPLICNSFLTLFCAAIQAFPHSPQNPRPSIEPQPLSEYSTSSNNLYPSF